MIGKLKGIIEVLGEETLLLDVGGVGYVVFCSAYTLRQMPRVGEASSLWIETHVREDHIHLYGFATIEEKNIFQQLVKVNGVGNKMALAILSTLTPQQVITAIHAQDKQALQSAPGVGPKLAVRLLTELKDKVLDVGFFVMPEHTGSVEKIRVTEPQGVHISDAVSALVNLGYSRSDAYLVVYKIAAHGESLPVDKLIRESLKELAGA